MNLRRRTEAREFWPHTTTWILKSFAHVYRIIIIIITQSTALEQ